MSAITPLSVNGRIGRDGIEPGSEPPSLLELLALEVDQQERSLENILRHLRIAQISAEIVVQLTLIPRDERLEILALARRPVLRAKVLRH